MKQQSSEASTRNPLILLELNEVNFDIVGKYIKAAPGRYAHLERMMAGASVRTRAEEHYELLEPWIQWVSVHSGLSYAEHNIMRLGDVVGSKVPQIFEQLEGQGIDVGCISPMNAENRLSSPAYFIPDPWTKTPTDGSWWSKALAGAVSQAVNDNAASRISPRNVAILVMGLLRFARPAHYGRFIKLVLKSKGASWRKALLLDLLLHDLHMHLFRSKRPQFSTLFLNAGAHIQHHYLLSAKQVKDVTSVRNPHWYAPGQADPVAELLDVYNDIIGEFLSLKDAEIIVATGLSQKPYDRIKYYYRLKDHAQFLRMAGIRFKAVHPRMTRDFLIEFDTNEEAATACKALQAIQVKDEAIPLFNEIDNRGTSLFVTLTYPDEITEKTVVMLSGQPHKLATDVTFVAIKNGMHQQDGFAFFTPGVAGHAPENGAHVKELNKTIKSYFLRMPTVAAAA